MSGGSDPGAAHEGGGVSDDGVIAQFEGYDDLAELCLRCLAKSPGDRPSAAEVANCTFNGLAEAWANHGWEVGWAIGNGEEFSRWAGLVIRLLGTLLLVAAALTPPARRVRRQMRTLFSPRVTRNGAWGSRAALRNIRGRGAA